MHKLVLFGMLVGASFLGSSVWGDEPKTPVVPDGQAAPIEKVKDSPKEIPTEGTVENASAHPPYWYIGSAVGGSFTTIDTAEFPFLGGHFDVETGANLSFFRLGVFYRASAGFTTDLGFTGGGTYGSKLVAGTVDFDLLPKSKDDLRIGLQLGHAWLDGVRAIIGIPYAVDSYKGPALGLRFDYVSMVSKVFGIGVGANYVYHFLEGVSDSLISGSSTSYINMKQFAVKLNLEFRPFGD